MLNTATLKTVTESFAKSSAIHRVRDDAHQTAWCYLFTRRTRWNDPEKLRSQARNAIADATRTIARAEKFDRRTILSALEWDQVIDHDREPLDDQSDLESLSFGAWLIGRAHCRRLVNTHERNTCDDWQDMVTDELIAEFERTQTLPNSATDVRSASQRVADSMLAEILSNAGSDFAK